MAVALIGAVVLFIVIVAIVLAKTVPTKAEHELIVRTHISAYLKPQPGAEGIEQLVKGGLRVLEAFAQGADVSYIDVLGFRYEEHTFYSVVKDPKKPEKEELVSFGIFNKVYSSDSSKAAPPPLEAPVQID